MISDRISAKLWSKRNLPEEFWPEILSRLPVKSLLRFRSVSRQWKAFIDDPSFAKSHLTSFKNNLNQSHLFVVQRSFDQPDCVVRCSRTFRATARLGTLNSDALLVKNLDDILPRDCDLQSWYVVGSIDGLFLLRNEVFDFHPSEFVLNPNLLENSGAELMLWNPSIRKVRTLPPPPKTEHRITIDAGLGFDPEIDDYKHVRFVMVKEETLISVAIYTFGANSWKEIGFEGVFDWRWHTMPFNFSMNVVCFRGCLYFMLRHLQSANFELISFHLSREKFDSSSMPADQKINYGFGCIDPFLTLADGGSSVAAVYITDNDGSIWVWEGTEPMTWSKRYTFASRIPDDYPKFDGIITFLYLKSNGEMILEWGWSLVTYYNLDTHAEKVVLKNKGFRMTIGGAFVHIENLMLL